MTTQEKCEAILRKMLELANDGKPVTLREDWGGNSATIAAGDSHTHVGFTDIPWEQFVDQLYNSLHGGPGLSWA
ncbi:MAG TPA: hypothetical protein VN442_14235 [Bryobacteraceae bacterium]|nr:hypothetical protein [Bryobacteraceae bacterium]